MITPKPKCDGDSGNVTCDEGRVPPKPGEKKSTMYLLSDDEQIVRKIFSGRLWSTKKKKRLSKAVTRQVAETPGLFTVPLERDRHQGLPISFVTTVREICDQVKCAITEYSCEDALYLLRFSCAESQTMCILKRETPFFSVFCLVGGVSCFHSFESWLSCSQRQGSKIEW
jgi:hypothetical protein